ncbi:MAG: DUF89 family protein, partial [Candidatus Omnitrophica bacterium]|nr:DUF89 family protein [Candidatus Omnitrophota bacterium]
WIDTPGEEGLVKQIKGDDAEIYEITSRKPSRWMAIDYKPGYLCLEEAPKSGGDSKIGKLEQVKEHLKRATDDQELISRVEAILDISASNPFAKELTTMQYEGLLHRIVKFFVNEKPESDGYFYQKTRDISAALHYLEAQELVEKGKNWEDKLRVSMLLAEVANLFDPTYKGYQKTAKELGILDDINSRDFLVRMKAEQDINKALFVRVSNLGLVWDDFDKFLEQLRNYPGGLILYYLDNHGEVIYDLLVIGLLLQKGYKVAVVGRGELVGNDVTYKEFEMIIKGQSSILNDIKEYKEAVEGFKKYLNNGNLIITTDGSYLFGADLTQADKHPVFCKIWKQEAIAYIAKGAGNYHTLFGQKLSIPGLHILMMKAFNHYERLSYIKKVEIQSKSDSDLAVIYQEKSREYRNKEPDSGRVKSDRIKFLEDKLDGGSHNGGEEAIEEKKENISRFRAIRKKIKVLILEVVMVIIDNISMVHPMYFLPRLFVLPILIPTYLMQLFLKKVMKKNAPVVDKDKRKIQEEGFYSDSNTQEKVNNILDILNIECCSFFAEDLRCHIDSGDLKVLFPKDKKEGMGTAIKKIKTILIPYRGGFDYQDRVVYLNKNVPDCINALIFLRYGSFFYRHQFITAKNYGDFLGRNDVLRFNCDFPGFVLANEFLKTLIWPFESIENIKQRMFWRKVNAKRLKYIIGNWECFFVAASAFMGLKNSNFSELLSKPLGLICKAKVFFYEKFNQDKIEEGGYFILPQGLDNNKSKYNRFERFNIILRLAERLRPFSFLIIAVILYLPVINFIPWIFTNFWWPVIEFAVNLPIINLYINLTSIEIFLDLIISWIMNLKFVIPYFDIDVIVYLKTFFIEIWSLFDSAVSFLIFFYMFIGAIVAIIALRSFGKYLNKWAKAGLVAALILYLSVINYFFM